MAKALHLLAPHTHPSLPPSPGFRVSFSRRLRHPAHNTTWSRHGFLTTAGGLLGPWACSEQVWIEENSSSGLVSMIWWEVLLSSNGIWQLTGGGLWELSSWQSRWEEARRGCRWNGTTWERGQRGQRSAMSVIEASRKLHYNHLTVCKHPKNK